MPANQGTFPARNRIIAALSTAVLITEAAEDSGSLITARCAWEQGKIVFAVPGPITSQMSKGSFRLLKQGAILVQSAEDVINALEFKTKNLKSKATTMNLKLSKDEKRIIDALENESMTRDEISMRTKISPSKLAIILSEMEIKGLIKNMAGTFHA
jgi:DNA processing protein